MSAPTPTPTITAAGHNPNALAAPNPPEEIPPDTTPTPELEAPLTAMNEGKTSSDSEATAVFHEAAGEKSCKGAADGTVVTTTIVRVSDETETETNVNIETPPSPSPSPTPNPPLPLPLPLSKHIRRNARPVSDLLCWTAAWAVFTVSYITFVYLVLIEQRVQTSGPAPVFLDASTTNLLVSVLSQVYVTLADQAVRGALEAVKRGLVVAEHRGGGRGGGHRGASGAAFFGVSAATAWLAVARLLAHGWLPNLWRAFFSRRRLARHLGEGALLVSWLGVPVMGLAFAAVLKYQANFAFYFQPNATTPPVPVFAGPTPLDNRVLAIVPQAVLCLYFQGQTAGLLTNAKYATGYSYSVDVDGCDAGAGSCRALILPGGLETVRELLPEVADPPLNETLFSRGGGGVFDEAETIRIDDAPATVLVFRNVGGTSSGGGGHNMTIDADTECVYAGQSINDTLQVCVRQAGEGISFGWAACPQEQYDANTCSTDRAWTAGPLRWATTMTAFRQRAATSYDRQNFSIVDVRPASASTSASGTSSPLTPLLLNASDYVQILRAVLLTSPKSSVQDVAAAESLVYALTWLHRTYQGYFPHDQSTLLTNLHNFVAVPLQFTVTALQFANYTFSSLGSGGGGGGGGGGFPMPPDARATATAGWSRAVLAIQPWTGWVFIAAASLLLLLVLACLVWVVVLLPGPLPPSTGVGEVDALRWARHLRVTEDDATVPLLDRIVGVAGEGEQTTTQLAKEIRNWEVSASD